MNVALLIGNIMMLHMERFSHSEKNNKYKQEECISAGCMSKRVLKMRRNMFISMFNSFLYPKSFYNMDPFAVVIFPFNNVLLKCSSLHISII